MAAKTPQEILDGAVARINAGEKTAEEAIGDAAKLLCASADIAATRVRIREFNGRLVRRRDLPAAVHRAAGEGIIDAACEAYVGQIAAQTRAEMIGQGWTPPPGS